VVANLQPLWARLDREIVETKLPLLGPDRARRHFPFASLARAGARLAMGSDWPVTSPDPLWGLHTAVHRTAPREDPHGDERARREPLLPEERLTPEQALHAYTAGAAYANHLEQSTGRLVPGMAADLVLVDGDLDDPRSFETARVRGTWVDGEPVFTSEGAG